ncbi:MAG: hypothetical protein J6V69_00080 [Clostridia bacterium]|nr:hypothetical protein [Clostridia bacterium]
MDNNIKKANSIYNSLCSYLEKKNLSFKRDEENLSAFLTFETNDIPIEIIVDVDTELQIISLLSFLPFKMDENKLIEGSIATSCVNCCLIDGSFDYDVDTGTICFRISSSFLESLIADDVFHYMFTIAINTIDDYNEQFLFLNKDKIKIDEFLNLLKD